MRGRPQGWPALFASFLVGLVLLLIGGVASASFTVPPKPNTPVYDGADVLTPEQERELASSLTSFRDKSGPEIAVAIVPTLGDHDLREVGYEIAQTWGIGDAKKKDGALLLIVVDKAKAAGPGAEKCGCAVIEVGEYLEGTLTDASLVQILRSDVLAPVVEGNYYEAVKAGTSGMMAVVGGDAKATQKKTAKDDGEKGGLNIPWWMWLIGVAVLVVLQALGVPVFEIVLVILSVGRSGGGSSSGGSSSGGFGGGGSFGGGGGKI
jgi:uncharacterized protein